MNIVNVGYDSTNYYILDANTVKLLIDCGWPGTLPKFIAELKRKGISINEIKYLLVTHFHPDHAGLTQELKKLGIKLVLLESQISFIAPFAEFFKGKNFPYVEITQNDNLVLKFEDSSHRQAGIKSINIKLPEFSPRMVAQDNARAPISKYRLRNNKKGPSPKMNTRL